ncbi:MAG: hypothetical protein ACKVVP_02810 [Chloroflexota bacterium]
MTFSCRILVVGVLDAFEGVLKRWFSEWEYEARFALNPSAAHDIVADWTPELILVDHLRNPRDFPTWWSELRAHPILAATPTIVTGISGTRSVQHEAAGTLPQPYTRSELESMIARVHAARPSTSC